MNRKIRTKIISGMLLGTMCVYTAPVFAFTKDETVYTKMNSMGEKYQTIVSTHIENDEGSDVIQDISDLMNIENTNGEEEFTQEGNSLIWKADKKDIYYQGDSQKDLPIQCHIKYELDGKEMKAEEILGKAGHVKITIQYINKEEHIVSINGQQQKMYTPFVVVAGTILPNDSNKNIEISNGKIINDGSKAMLMGIALPGLQESLNIKKSDLKIPNDIEITMDATDFELGNIITFVTPKVIEKEDLMTFDKIDEVYHKVDTLQSSSNQILQGANELKEGTVTYSEKSNEFNNAINKLSDGVSTINTNYTKLDNGINDLKSGSTELLAGVETLNKSAGALSSLGTLTQAVSQLYTASTATNDGITALEAEIRENNITLQNTINALEVAGYTDSSDIMKNLKSQKAKNEGLLNALEPNNNPNKKLSNASVSLKNGLKTMNDSVSNLSGIDKLTAGADKLLTGTNQLSLGIDELSKGSGELKNGIQSLDTNTKKLVEANGQLTQGAKTLANGSSTLVSGLQTFNEQGIDKICDYINGDLKDTTERIEKLTELSKEYNNFTMLNGNNEGNVKFIMIMDAIKKQENNGQVKENAVLPTEKQENKEEK